MRKLLVNMLGIILWSCLLVCFKNCAGETVTEILTSKSKADETEIVKVQEVDTGKTAILVCYSNDEEHFFQFWHLANDDAVVGPGNIYNPHKYDYEILSGNLIIRQVSSEEEGVYHCVSRGVRTNDINIRSVRMIVKKDWDELEIHDPGVNYFRGVVIVGSLLVVAVAIYFAYKLKNRHRLQSLLEEDDEEDSAEEIFRAPSTSHDTRNIVLNREDDDDPVEIPKISIDFEDILQHSHK